MLRKTGVLLINLGTPDEPTTASVKKYLKQFLLDPRVIDTSWLSRQLLVRMIIAPRRSPDSARLYKELWTQEGSPIKYYGFRVRDKLQDLMGDNYIVELGMRYQNPSIEKALEKLRAENVGRIIVFPLFPHYASASTGSALQKAMEIVATWSTIPSMEIIDAYFDHPGMVRIFADNARQMGLDNYDHFLFSFHGVPERQLIKSDYNNYCLQSLECCHTLNNKNEHCYSAQCYATARAIARDLQLDKEQYNVSFQSRLGKEKWTEPFTPDMLRNLFEKGKKRILVFSPSFVADCLETTIEIGCEYKEDFLEWGGERLDLVESLNDKDEWVRVIYNILNGKAYNSASTSIGETTR